jgi:hypothetical protein
VPTRPALAPALRRFLKHPRLMHYNRLIALAVVINLGVLSYHLARGDWQIDDGSALSALATMTLLNFTAAVVIRQRHVLNLVFTLLAALVGERLWRTRARRRS